MSVLKYKDPETGDWFPAPMVKVVNVVEYEGGSITGVPADIVAEAERVASSIQTKIAANSVNFIAVSDMHEMGDSDHTSATIIERYRRANLNAGQGARLIAEKISPDFFVNLGDLAWGASTTTLHDWAQSVTKARGYTAGIEALTECFYTPGNHDVDYADGYHDENLVTGMIGTYRYVDLTGKKVRVICLNTADTTDGTDSTERVSGEQLQWFAEALDLSGKTDAASWGIIVLSHHPLDWNSNIKPLANCLAAYLNGTTYSATHDGLTVSYDYTGKNAATFIANFHGHTHCFKTATISGTDAVRVAIPNACYGRNNEYGQSGNTEFGETTTYNKTDGGTGKNTAFCVVSVDLDRKIIYADCFGAGYDRVLSYSAEEIVTYTITNNLTDATNSNGTATILGGSSYSGVIVPNVGYEVDTITVTMGGKDITSTAVSGTTVTIAEVTGDIVITATTNYVEVDGYTNLVPLSTSDGTNIFDSPLGYRDGVYLSSGAANSYSTDAACVSTGNIVLPSGVESIYVKGATWDATNDHVRWHFGSVIGGLSYTFRANGNGDNDLSNFFTFEELDTDYYRFTLTSMGKSYLYGKYYRMSLVGTGANLIITHDQPITD